MVFKIETDNKKKFAVYKVTMKADEWDRLKFYSATDSEGNLATDTSKLIKGCKDKSGG